MWLRQNIKLSITQKLVSSITEYFVLKFVLQLLYLCGCARTCGCVLTCACMYTTCGSQRTTGVCLFLSYHVGPGDQMQVVRLDSKHLCLLSHLSDPPLCTLLRIPVYSTVLLINNLSFPIEVPHFLMFIGF